MTRTVYCSLFVLYLLLPKDQKKCPHQWTWGMKLQLSGHVFDFIYIYFGEFLFLFISFCSSIVPTSSYLLIAGHSMSTSFIFVDALNYIWYVRHDITVFTHHAFSSVVFCMFDICTVKTDAWYYKWVIFLIVFILDFVTLVHLNPPCHAPSLSMLHWYVF